MLRAAAIAYGKLTRLKPFALIAILLLGACQSLPPIPQGESELSLQGRLKITLGEDANSSSFRWTQTKSGFDAYFWGAMGAGTTHLFGDRERLNIESRNGTFSGPPAEILEQHLGWSVPIELLLTWVRGVPSADMGLEQLERDGDGRLVSFRQAGWLLRFDGFDELGRYTRLTARRDDVTALLIVKKRTGA